MATGTHAITLTGNYIESLYDEDEDDEDDDEDDEDMDDMLLGGSDEDSDDLDDVSDPRITEVESEDEAPALVPAKKGKNKRSAPDAEEGLDAMITDSKDEEPKLSKKAAKKAKTEAAAAALVEEKKKGDKKVQFAKELEQGPTGTTAAKEDKKPVLRVVQGVTIDDRKIGSGRTAKNGDNVGMRYIGKLQNGKQFDGKF